MLGRHALDFKTPYLTGRPSSGKLQSMGLCYRNQSRLALLTATDNKSGRTTVLFDGGFTFQNFLADAFAIFMFVLWFWLFITVTSDLFRRHDLSGWAKVLWVIALVFFSYIGIFAYILTQGRGMAERNQAREQQARDELRQIVGFSVADEIAKLDRLKSTGSISDQEYARLRAKVVG
jgi:hypothetical protein